MIKLILSLALLLSLSGPIASACDEHEAKANSSHPSFKLVKSDSNKAVFQVKGMMCSSCKNKIEAALKKVDGVKAVTFRMKEKLAEVAYTGTLNRAAMVQAVKDAGFEATEKL